MYYNSYESFDLSWLASQVSDTFAKRDTGDPVIIGLFFEPSVYPDKEYRFDYDKFKKNPEKWKLHEEQGRKGAKERGKEKLRQQVAHFVDYLKKEGVVE